MKLCCFFWWGPWAPKELDQKFICLLFHYLFLDPMGPRGAQKLRKDFIYAIKIVFLIETLRIFQSVGTVRA